MSFSKKDLKDLRVINLTQAGISQNTRAALARARAGTNDLTPAHVEEILSALRQAVAPINRIIARECPQEADYPIVPSYKVEGK